MTETIYEMSKRMCDSTNCKDCLLNKVTNKSCLIGIIKYYEIEKVAEQLEVLYEWVKEHPAKNVYNGNKCKKCWDEPYKEENDE